jgi:hypothetical protein
VRDVLRTDLKTTCLGVNYLEDLKLIQQPCKFDLTPAKEHIFSNSSQSMDHFLAYRLSYYTKMPENININHHQKFFNHHSTSRLPNTAKVSLHSDSDLETIHYEWTWNWNVLFPTYHNEAFKATINHLQNLTAISVETINAAMAEAMAQSHSGNKRVHDYL